MALEREVDKLCTVRGMLLGRGVLNSPSLFVDPAIALLGTECPYRVVASLLFMM